MSIGYAKIFGEAGKEFFWVLYPQIFCNESDIEASNCGIQTKTPNQVEQYEKSSEGPAICREEQNSF